jgi:hypothetical protein
MVVVTCNSQALPPNPNIYAMQSARLAQQTRLKFDPSSCLKQINWPKDLQPTTAELAKLRRLVVARKELQRAREEVTRCEGSLARATAEVMRSGTNVEHRVDKNTAEPSQ